MGPLLLHGYLFLLSECMLLHTIDPDPGDKVYYKHDKERTKFEVSMTIKVDNVL